MEITVNNNLDLNEIKLFFTQVFEDLEFSGDSQSLDEWINLEEIINYGVTNGKFIEVRESGKLIGGAFVGKQNPISWSDGRKCEIFIMGVKLDSRGKNIGSKLLEKCSEVAKKLGGKKLIVNTNTLMEDTIRFYKKNNYSEIGLLKDYYDNGDAIFLVKDL